MLPKDRIRILRLMERMYDSPEYFDEIGVCIEWKTNSAEPMDSIIEA